MATETRKISPKIIDFIKRIDIIYFTLFFLKLEPFNYQIDFLLDDNKRIVLNSGRQVGKSTMTSIKALYNCFKNDNYTVLILAPTFRQASLIFEKIRGFVSNNSLLMSGIERMTMTMLFTKNGSKIYCLPSGRTGDTVRGYTSDLIIFDEAAYIDDRVFISIEPSISTTKGTVLLLSTPIGKKGYFYECFNSDNFHKYHITSYDCPLISKEFLDKKKREMDDISFKQEYLAEFVDDTAQLIPFSLLKQNIDYDLKNMCDKIRDLHYNIKLYTDNPLYMGIDVARTRDYTAIVIFEKIRDEKENKTIYVQRYLETIRGMPIPDQHKHINKLLKCFPSITKVRIDSTGMGTGLFDYLLNEHKNKIEGINFASSIKGIGHKSSTPVVEKMAVNFKVLLQNNEVSLIDNDLQSRHITGIDYNFKSLRNNTDGHGDLFYAICLALLPHNWRRPAVPLISNISSKRLFSI